MEAIVDAAVADDWALRQHLSAGRLVTLFDNCPLSLLDSIAVWPDTPYLSRRVRLAIETVVAHLLSSAKSPSAIEWPHWKGVCGTLRLSSLGADRYLFLEARAGCDRAILSEQCVDVNSAAIEKLRKSPGAG